MKRQTYGQLLNCAVSQPAVTDNVVKPELLSELGRQAYLQWVLATAARKPAGREDVILPLPGGLLAWGALNRAQVGGAEGAVWGTLAQ